MNGWQWRVYIKSRVDWSGRLIVLASLCNSVCEGYLNKVFCRISINNPNSCRIIFVQSKLTTLPQGQKSTDQSNNWHTMWSLTHTHTRAQSSIVSDSIEKMTDRYSNRIITGGFKALTAAPLLVPMKQPLIFDCITYADVLTTKQVWVMFALNSLTDLHNSTWHTQH